jgi:hypothetical protein
MHEHVTFLQAPLDQPLDVWFEPWGDGFTLSSGLVAELRATSTLPGELEIVKETDYTTVYAWPGSTLRIVVNGEVVYDFSIAVPDTPDGLTMKGFVKALFGDTPQKP